MQVRVAGESMADEGGDEHAEVSVSISLSGCQRHCWVHR